MGVSQKIHSLSRALIGWLMIVVSVSADEGIELYEHSDWTVRGHIQTGVNAVAETNLFWDLAANATNNTDFDADAQWLELYLEPGVSFETTHSDDLQFFGKLSFVASYTAGTDAFDTGDTGRTTLEEGYLGIRAKTDSGLEIETTLGPQVLKIGNRMLITNGGSDGFTRGALKFGPREAWEMAGVLKASWQKLTSTLFYIDANEPSDNDSENELAGFDVRWDDGNNNLGINFIHVTRSEAPYPKAPTGGVGPPEFINGAREGLNSVNVYGNAHGFEALSGEFSFWRLSLSVGQ
ncbi:MAG: hypothetical protein MK080_07470 [Opitutales bacterium]|nr:hypothetical protein [Opitutales bacterium]